MDNDVLNFAMVMAVCVVSTVLFIAIGLATRWLYNRGTPQTTTVAAHDDERMQRLETAVDTIAIEVERISEAQRFMVGLLSESLPARQAELAAPDRSGRVITPY